MMMVIIMMIMIMINVRYLIARNFSQGRGPSRSSLIIITSIVNCGLNINFVQT